MLKCLAEYYLCTVTVSSIQDPITSGGKQKRYKTSGVCSSAIEFELDDQKKIHNVKFQGGCSGNTQGVARLVEGMEAEEAIRRLEGIRCGVRPTSCPDQLSKALKEALA